MASTNSIT